MADPKHRGLPPHYQQLGRDQLPIQRVGEADVFTLIGNDSPVEQHMDGRLQAITVDAGGSTTLALPKGNEQLFFYVTDGAGSAIYNDMTMTLGQYDVVITRPDAKTATLTAAADENLYALAFYLPPFMNMN
jgi:redox-sensitive bicupin YhaK (pirin superfamily)